MRIVPLRSGLLFAAAVNRTSPGPLPDVAESVIQSSSLCAVQGQAAFVETATPDVVLKPLMSIDDGAIEYEQPLACVTVNELPPTLTVPVRAGPEFDAIVRSTRPGPLPCDPDVTVIHESRADAVQPQPAFVATWTAAEPPRAPTSAFAGLRGCCAPATTR